MDYVFTVSGNLPAPWEDFFATLCGVPLNISIYSQEYLVAEGENPLDFLHEDEGDGWSDVVTLSTVITEEIAKRELSYMLCCSPDKIHIRQLGVSQAV